MINIVEIDDKQFRIEKSEGNYSFPKNYRANITSLKTIDIVSIYDDKNKLYEDLNIDNVTINGVSFTDVYSLQQEINNITFKTPSGGSGGGAVDSWNGQTGVVTYDVWKKVDGTTNADSFSEDIRHDGDIQLYSSVSGTKLLELEVQETSEGATNANAQISISRDGLPFGGSFPFIGNIIGNSAPNDGAPNFTFFSNNTNDMFNVLHGFSASGEVMRIKRSGQLLLNKYTGANFDGEGQFLTVDSTGLVKKSVGSTLTVISWLTRHRGTLASPITISSTPVDLTSVLGNLTLTSENGIITYDAVNNVFKADANTTSYYAFDVVIRLTGTVQGGGTSSFIFELRRPDNVTIITSDYSRIGGTGNLLNTQVSAIDTRVFSGGTDNYQTQGFRIFGRKVDGNNLILSNGVDDFQELILER